MEKNKKEGMRKGPWSEEEDAQLVFYVNLFGERRWDFIAKVSGLKRSGKSCRLRWVNYLQPGLKRDKITPHEETLLLHLHSKWGNRWSRIARKLPGRTDNEIKNYWRSHMRKMGQQKKKAQSSNSSSSDSADVKRASNGPSLGLGLGLEESVDGYSMEEIWKDIELSEGSSTLSGGATWDFCGAESLWSVDDEDHSRMLMQQMGDYYYSFPFTKHIYDHGK